MRYMITSAEKHFKKCGIKNFATPREAIENLKDAKILGFDTETSGLGSYLNTRTYCLAIGNKYYQYCIVIGYYDEKGEWVDDSAILKEFKKLFSYKGKYKEILWVAHNAAFDLPRIYQYDIVLKNVHCTYTCEKQIQNGFETRGLSLSACLLRYLGVEMSKEPVKDIIDKGIHNEESFAYACKDVEHLPDLVLKQEEMMEQLKMTKDMELHRAYEPVNAYMEYCGIHLDQELIEWYASELDYLIWNLREQMEAIVTEDWPGFTEWKKEHALNGQYLKWTTKETITIFKQLGINVIYKGKESIDVNKVLRNRQSQHRILPLYIEYSKYRQYKNTFGRNMLEHVRPETKRIHTRFKPFIATGRTSSGASAGEESKLGKGFVNLQNMPNNNTYRACFKPQGNTYFVGGDFSGQESRILAALSGDAKMLEFYRSGEKDIYAWSAKQSLPEIPNDMSVAEIKEKFPEKRRLFKSAILSLQYSGTWWTVMQRANVPKQVAMEMVDRYFGLFPRVKEFQQECIAFTMNHGYMRSCNKTGRKRFIPDLKKAMAGELPRDQQEAVMYKVTSESTNSICQGTAASMTKLAMIWIWDWILKNNKFGKIKIVLQVHDEILLECHPNYKEEVASQLKYCMETAAKVFIPELPIPVEPWIDKKYIK